MPPRTRTTSTKAGENTIPALANAGYFSDYYLTYRLDSGLKDLYVQWDEAEKIGDPTPRTRLRSLANAFDKYRVDATSTEPEQAALDEGHLDLRDLPSDAVAAQRDLNDAILEALGWTSDRKAPVELTSGDLTITVPVAHRCDTHTGTLLLALDTVFSTDPAAVVAGKAAPAGRLLEPVLMNGKPAARTALEAAQLIFTADSPPNYLLLASGGSITLLDRDRWGEGISIGADLDGALARHDTKPKGELASIAALFSAAAINPGAEAQSVLAGLLEKATTESAGVSKDLRHGMRRSVELIANAVVTDMRERQKVAWKTIDPKELTRQTLRYLYRIIVLLFAEARPELGILPADDPDYQSGYSLARLRDIALVDLHSDHARNARHLQHSLDLLFSLVNDGHLADANLTGDDSRDLSFPGLRSSLFADAACPLVDRAHLPDIVLKQVLAHLCFTKEKSGTRRQAVSYSTLGINQLGAVYEGLMAYSGFLATEPLYEIANDGDPDNGSWVIPVTQADEFSDEMFLTDEAPDGSRRRVQYHEGDFVFRLSGRDRQRSASYYTPEVLTEFTVRHALEVLFEENPGLTAVDTLKLTICEPALGSGAFANEAVNQLAARYLKMAQDERGETIDADRYRNELQKAKAHFAVNQVFGVDLNQTAVELAEVSLWLNCMHRGLLAPWFGARLRRGNSLIGARRSTYTADQVRAMVWSGKTAAPPTDQPLKTVPFGQANGIHHFLLPGEGWGGGGGATELKDLAPEWVAALKSWQLRIFTRPNQHQITRLQALAERVEVLWERAAKEVHNFWEATRQHVEVWGNDTPPAGRRFGVEAIRRVLHDPRSATFRLRTTMNAWCSIWMWSPQHGTSLPTLDEWLGGLEAILRVEDRPFEAGVLFSDERQLDYRIDEMTSVDEAATLYPWLTTCQEISETQGWFHWELDFAPVFLEGGFHLQIGNPPWRRPTWDEPAALAEHDPWWGVTDLKKIPDQEKDRRRQALLLADSPKQDLMATRAETYALGTQYASGAQEPYLVGIQTNLYMLFMTASWRHLGPKGVAALIHQEAHLVDPKAGRLRAATYSRLRRHWQFSNATKLFPEIGDRKSFSVNIYGDEHEIRFLQAVQLLDPTTLDRSLRHDGVGDPPTIQYPTGGYDIRPHRDRIVIVDRAVLSSWVRLFDPLGTPPERAALQRPLTRQDLGALLVLAAQPDRLGQEFFLWTRGFDEDKIKKLGTAEWFTSVPSSLDDVILQGPHILNGTPFGQQPRQVVNSNNDWDAVAIGRLPAEFVPRTNYRRLVDIAEYRARQTTWEGEPYTFRYRESHREFVESGTSRVLQSCILPPGPAHIHKVNSIARASNFLTVRWCGLLMSLPYDFLTKTSGAITLGKTFAGSLPVPAQHSGLDSGLVFRVLRLNCVTRAYDALWRELYETDWATDSFGSSTKLTLGVTSRSWLPDVPLRSDHERWLALCDIDAIVSLLLGLSADQLVQAYRSQFDRLRKYETRMVFDFHGNQLCGIHHAFGPLQTQWEATRHNDRLPNGTSGLSMWERVQLVIAGDCSIDLGPFLPPFTQADRETAMTTAYWAFVDRYKLTPPDIADRPS